MVYKIEFDDAAKKQMKKLPRQVQASILDYLEHKIAPLENPRSRGEGLKANLSGLWRYRVENYRVISRIIENKMTVLVIKVGHRSEVYE